MLPSSHPVPLPARILNAAAGFLPDHRDLVIGPDVSEYMESVSRRIGLSDYGDGYFKEGFERLLESYRADTDLTLVGEILQRTAIERSLENRLRYIEYRRKNPEVFQRRPVPPIIVMGLPRSGTTFLHRLLGADPRNRGLYLWELIHPAPSMNGPDRRRFVAAIESGIARSLMIHMDHIHVIADSEYEECIWLTLTTFHSLAFYVMAPVFSYVEWFRRQPQLRIYEEYLELLKIFQAQTPTRRLTLKAPAHTGSLPEIRRVIPEAILVQTHRNPLDVMNSLNSLMYFAHCTVSKQVDVRKMAECNLGILESEIQRNLLSRKDSGIAVHDIFYEEILVDPFAVVLKLYNAHGIEMTPEAENRMRQFIAMNPQHKHGTHKYRPADFGIPKTRIADAFHEYMKEFGYNALNKNDIGS